MKLYEITSAYREALELSESDEYGDLTPLLDAITDKIETKVDNICRLIREQELEADAYQAEAERLTAQARRLAKKAEGLKGYLSHCLAGNPIKTELFNLSFRKSESIEVEDFDALPVQYKREKYLVEADKNLIKGDLKCGAQIPGVKLVTKQNLQIK